MGAVLGLPLLGSFAGIASSVLSACIGGLAFFCTSQAASAFFKSCNCNSSVATRVGFSLIFLLNSLAAWLSLTDWAIKLIQKLSWDWIKMECKQGKCYGVLAVHRICFALALFHLILAALLVQVKDTRTKRAAIQNGWWGPKLLSIIVLTFLSFLIPNGFFMFYSSYVALPGATIFILVGLVLLVDFAHSWSEQCLERWEETNSDFWKWVLIGSTLAMYAVTITLVGLQYGFFAGSGCSLNQGLITTNLILSVIVTVLSIHPRVQDANPRSGLSQSGMVVAYTAYLVTSAIANHDDNKCNPLTARAAGARNGMVVLGAVFTFLAIAYSTSRAATQSRALTGKKGSSGSTNSYADYESIPTSSQEEMSHIADQPTKKDSLRYQAILAAVQAGSLPASALDDAENDDDEDGENAIEMRNDDEKNGTRYSYSFFHVIFALGSMYVAMLLTNWNIVVPNQSGGGGSEDGSGEGAPMVKIGRSHAAMWMRIVSAWLCQGLYVWSLVAPVLLPDRFE